MITEVDQQFEESQEDDAPYCKIKLNLYGIDKGVNLSESDISDTDPTPKQQVTDNTKQKLLNRGFTKANELFNTTMQTKATVEYESSRIPESPNKRIFMRSPNETIENSKMFDKLLCESKQILQD